jgi:hypothetical protein
MNTLSCHRPHILHTLYTNQHHYTANGNTNGNIKGYERETQDEDIMICYPEKFVSEAMQLFTARYKMHQTVSLFVIAIY